MHTGKVYLIGAGPGDPELLTLKAVKALQAADVWLVDDLVSREVLGFARPDARIVHVGKRGGCRSTPQAFIHRLMLRYARHGKVVARVKGGDPFIFGRGGEEWQWLAERGVSVEAVGGLTAGLAVGPALGLPLTHRGLSRGVTLVTAHTQDGSPLPWAALAQSGLTVVCYMGMSDLPSLTTAWREAGFAADLPVAVVHRVGCPEQRAVVSTLANLVADVREARLASPAVIVLGEVAGLAALQPQLEQVCRVA
ncbi:uroporphyrin-III C-methyltransferase [Pseudogulbenkiania sp. NH8B]|uniref:uroporphyrinogen-III C-methyltransferase n=1 Tax=Pseudogulbenkiania sp. (strain NH8B) TaxID=748280 RepID=UPI00022799AF|nr:uroporphyrinogen-III C-methyltransferase [Pseudogulbenkiania sp. NH8B]BAK76298.1 uroporphyrin-III C-methyltransferase [Pseudogulbenkiania sp. NH8B]